MRAANLAIRVVRAAAIVKYLEAWALRERAGLMRVRR